MVRRRQFQSFLFTLFFLAVSAGISAQEAQAAVGIGAEWNMNARERYAGAAALTFDYALPYFFALGFTLTVSDNFSGFAAIEPAVTFRRYFFSDGQSGLFAQIDLGCFVISENREVTPMFDGGLRGGFRLPVELSFYIEPYGRLGYPFAFGIGVVAGIQFLK